MSCLPECVSATGRFTPDSPHEHKFAIRGLVDAAPASDAPLARPSGRPKSDLYQMQMSGIQGPALVRPSEYDGIVCDSPLP
jgi:hypothetical protein